jgi:hypothetical protein
VPISPLGPFAVSPTRSESGLDVALVTVVPERLLRVVVGVRCDPGLELARLMPLYVWLLVVDKVGEVSVPPREILGRDRLDLPVWAAVDVVSVDPLNFDGRLRGVGVEYISAVSEEDSFLAHLLGNLFPDFILLCCVKVGREVNLCEWLCVLFEGICVQIIIYTPGCNGGSLQPKMAIYG